MRAVIDTNVFVSSFFGGKPRIIIDRWKTGDITLCLSKDILDEYVEVLYRLSLPSAGVRELLDFFAKGIHLSFTRKASLLRVVRQDPDDDKFTGCAMALGAEVIITGDKALLSVGPYSKILILSPSEFLRRFP